jgi:ubiquinone/menaquinone biosynthesis C-methylase UbiE
VYWTSQAARVGWFLGEYLLSARLGRDEPPPAPPKAKRRRPTVGLVDLLSDLGTLLVRDRHNVRDGLYRTPHDLIPDVPAWLGGAIRYFRDLPAVTERRRRNGWQDVATEGPTGSKMLPDYYRRNFHFQTDGYLSEHSARLYDHQVDVLFMGAADAMRRQALPPIGAFLRRACGHRPRLLDIGCGTGQFLTFVRDSYSYLDVIGLDISRPYLAEAERRLARWTGAKRLCGLAEQLPIADGSVDIVTCTYLLHEVPSDIRRRIAIEGARVLKRPGRLVVVDSLQFGDRPEYDGMLAGFPSSFHEPYYRDYAEADLIHMFDGAGFTLVDERLAFLSKVMVFDVR